METKWITKKEAYQIFTAIKGKHVIYDWAYRKKINAKKVNGHYLFDQASIEAYMKSDAYRHGVNRSKPKRKTKAIVSMDIQTPLGEAKESIQEGKIAMIFIPATALKTVLETILR